MRDYLETLDWDKRAPGPKLPRDVIERTGEKYAEALRAPDRAGVRLLHRRLVRR